MTTQFKGPFVNINGASRKSLIKQHDDVASKAEELIQALGRAAPHGRDYQMFPDGKSYKEDRKVWAEYIKGVRDIYEEYRGVVERLWMDRPKGE